MFDVGLASPLKRFFSTRLKKTLKECANDSTIITPTAKFRCAVIIAFLDAWASARTPSNCRSAAKQTGIYPFNPNAVKDSIFVRDLLPEEQRRYEARQEYNARRLTTAMKIITDAEFIVQLSRLQELNTKFNHLC